MKRKKTRSVPVIFIITPRTRVNVPAVLAGILEYVLRCRVVVCAATDHPSVAMPPDLRGCAPEAVCVIYDYDTKQHSESLDRQMQVLRETWKRVYFDITFIAISRDLSDDEFPRSGVWGVTPRFANHHTGELIEYLRELIQQREKSTARPELQQE
ncbi:MAG: hypothetical protein Q7S96_01530 [bacterium]|nr:hypothetical protein [bacterium]